MGVELKRLRVNNNLREEIKKNERGVNVKNHKQPIKKGMWEKNVFVESSIGIEGTILPGVRMKIHSANTNGQHLDTLWH